MSLLPRTLFARLTLVLLGGLLAAQLLSFGVHMHDRSELLAQASGMRSAQRIADIVRLLDSMSPAERDKVVHVLSAPPLSVRLGEPPLSAPDANSESGARALLFGTLLKRFIGDDHPLVVGMAVGGPPRGIPGVGPGFGMMRHADDDDEGRSARHRGHEGRGTTPGGGMVFVAQVTLGDGTRVTFDARQPQATEHWPARLAGSIAVLLIAVIVVSLIAVRWATKPLKALAVAADALGREIHRPPLVETGPEEVASAARAFNTMQARLAGYLRERLQVFAAMSHDLKTPITRLRLRAELLNDPKLREKFDGDLREMELMVASALDFLRGMDSSEPVQPVDINALLESLAADIRETGGTVSVSGAVAAPFRGRVGVLKRGLANVLENAVKYGGSAQVYVEDLPDRLQIQICDNGPGLAEDQLEKVFEPFYRVEGSRNRDTGGTGLGLAIARNAAVLHGGTITLHNRPEGGLCARLYFSKK